MSSSHIVLKKTDPLALRYQQVQVTAVLPGRPQLTWCCPCPAVCEQPQHYLLVMHCNLWRDHLLTPLPMSICHSCGKAINTTVSV